MWLCRIGVITSGCRPEYRGSTSPQGRWFYFMRASYKGLYGCLPNTRSGFDSLCSLCLMRFYRCGTIGGAAPPYGEGWRFESARRYVWVCPVAQWFEPALDKRKMRVRFSTGRFSGKGGRMCQGRRVSFARILWWVRFRPAPWIWFAFGFGFGPCRLTGSVVSLRRGRLWVRIPLGA